MADTTTGPIAEITKPKSTAQLRHALSNTSKRLDKAYDVLYKLSGAFGTDRHNAPTVKEVAKLRTAAETLAEECAAYIGGEKLLSEQEQKDKSALDPKSEKGDSKTKKGETDDAKPAKSSRKTTVKGEKAVPTKTK